MKKLKLPCHFLGPFSICFGPVMAAHEPRQRNPNGFLHFLMFYEDLSRSRPFTGSPQAAGSVRSALRLPRGTNSFPSDVDQASMFLDVSVMALEPPGLAREPPPPPFSSLHFSNSCLCFLCRLSSFHSSQCVFFRIHDLFVVWQRNRVVWPMKHCVLYERLSCLSLEPTSCH